MSERLLRAADDAASVAHDFIWERNDVTKEQASDAIWAIHNALRPMFEDDPEPGTPASQSLSLSDGALEFIDAAGTGTDLEDTDGLSFHG